MNFHLPCTKTKEKGDKVNITDSTCPCSATTVLEHHLSSNVAILPSAPLFTFEMADGQWSPMQCSWFLSHCNAVWEKDSISSTKGHGFWIGGTTHLLLLGVGSSWCRGAGAQNLFLCIGVIVKRFCVSSLVFLFNHMTEFCLQWMLSKPNSLANRMSCLFTWQLASWWGSR